MSKRRREADTAADTAELDPVFVDTNLGTHLAILLCNSDTASDFKKKVAVEHKKCFPEIGEIKVHSVMVKRRSHYYHLPDIMHVKSAFHGVKSYRFLSVDASKISTCLTIGHSLERGASSDVKNAVAEPTTDKPLEKITDSHSGPYLEEHHMGTKSPAKKKRKLRHTEDACHNSTLEDRNVVVRPNGIEEEPNIHDVKGRLVSEGTSLPSLEEKFNVDSILNSQNITSTNRMEEGNTFKSMVDYGLGKDVLPLGAVSITAPDSSARMMNAGGGGGDVRTTGRKKRKWNKKRVKKTAAKIQDTTDTEQIGKGESVKPSTVEMKEVKGLLLEDDDKVIMPSNRKSPDHVGSDLALKEASRFQDAEKSNFSIVNSYKLQDSHKRKEDNVGENKMDYELDQNVPTVHSSGVCTNAADLPATMVDAGGGNGDVNSDGKKRKKKRKAKTSAKIKDTRDMEQIGENEVKKPQGETIRSEEKDISLNDDKVILPSESNYPDHVDPDLTQKEAWVMRDSDSVKKTAAKIQDTTDTEWIGKGESIKPSTVEMEEVKGLLSNSKSPDHVGSDLALQEASHFQDAEKSNFCIVNSYKLKDSDERKEDNLAESKVDYELDQNVPTVHSSGVCTNTADLSATMVDAGGGNGDVNSDGKKRKKKKKAQKSAKVKDTRDMEQTGENEMKPQAETIRSEEKVISLNDDKVILPSESNNPDHVDPDLTQKEASVMRDSDAVMEPEISRCNKKKGRKSIGPRKEKLGPAEIHEGIVGSLDLLSPSRDHIPMATGKDESCKLNEGTDVEMKLLGASDHDAQEKLLEVSRKEADLVETQSEHTLKFKSSAGDCHEDFPTAETEHTVMESNQAAKDNGNTKKKKTGRKSISTKKENLGITEIHNGIRGSSNLPSPSDEHIPKATGKDESIRINEGKNAQMKLLDASNHSAEEIVLEVNRKEADLVESQTLENVSVLNKMMTEKTQSSAGNHHADFPTAEPQNTITESTQTNKDNENGESKYKKPTKKRRKQKHTATDVQENLPVKDQQVGIEALATKEPSVFEKPELEGRDVDTSQVLSRRNEEKVDETHELVPNTNGLEESSERQYIVADQLQNKADYSDMVRKTTKVRRSRIAKTDDVPSANIPTNLQNSVTSFENKKSESNPNREDTLRTKCGSAHISDQDEKSPNSVRRSSKTAEKQNGRSVLGQKVSGKPSSCKSSSERSETLHNRRGDALLGQKISNMLRMKTPKKKISLAEPGGIFQDNSGESSGEDNGAMHSNAKTISPSDSSSMSGDSEGESELSQNSVSNGSTGAKAKAFSMFDFSASTEVGMTIDRMKRSDLFKKSMKVAKPIEPIEFDPDGQPI